MAGDQQVLARAEALLAEACERLPAQRARFDGLVAMLRAPDGEVTRYERGLVLEELADRGYMAGGYGSFGAFLKAHGIARTTAHRLRLLARASDAETVAELGPHLAYRIARADVGRGEVIDVRMTERRVRAWIRTFGIQSPRVEVVMDDRGQPCVRIEIRVRELGRVVDQPQQRRR